MLQVEEIESKMQQLVDCGVWIPSQREHARAILVSLQNGAALSFAYDTAEMYQARGEVTVAAAIVCLADWWVFALKVPTIA